VVLPNVPATAVLKVKAKGMKVLESQMIGPGLARIRVLPKKVDQLTQRSLDIRVRGVEDTRVHLTVDVLPGPAGTLRVTTDPPVLPASVSEAQIRIHFEGSHPQAVEARGIHLQASSGTLSEPIRMDDGSFLARYTAAKNRKAEMVVIAAADVHYPDQLLGAVVMPVREMRSLTLDAESDAAHLLHYGERTYGPFQPASGSFTVRVELDPRYTTGRLEVSRDNGKSQRSSIPLLEPAKPSLHFFPLPTSLPQGGTLEVHILRRSRLVDVDRDVHRSLGQLHRTGVGDREEKEYCLCKIFAAE
jgi:hypothetical protein